MNVGELKNVLARHSEMTVRFQLPNGQTVPAHAHVTEVARIDKHFVDCGGTLRADAMCRLQTWVHDDLDHRLTAGKLLRILEKAQPILKADELEVDVEHELEFISQFPLIGAEPHGSKLQLQLGTRHTACLAMELCCPPTASPLAAFKPLKAIS